MKSYQVVEIVGLLLLLISVGWELFFTISIEDIEQGIKDDNLNHKLDQLHYRQLQLQRHLDYKFSEIKTGAPVHGDPLAEKWNHGALTESLQRVARQSLLFRRVKAGLFIIGTLFVILAKVGEYQAPATTPRPAPLRESGPAR